GKFGVATSAGAVEKGHRGPGALAAIALLVRPIRLVAMEVVVMRLELLADRVTLPLDRFTKSRDDSHQFGDLGLDVSHRLVQRIEVAALARPDLGIGRRSEQA